MENPRVLLIIASILCFAVILTRQSNSRDENKYNSVSNLVDNAITAELSRRKRALPAFAISGIVQAIMGAVGGKLTDGLGTMGSNLTSGLIKGVVENIIGKILNGNEMEDIHNEITAYLDEWEKNSDVNAGEATKKLKEIIDSLAKKNTELLETKAKINIIPQKGMELADMFTPAGYKIETSYGSTKSEPDSSGSKAYEYDQGVGNVIINGCYKPSLSADDPCHAAKRLIPLCPQLLEGSTFIGVGFDGRGQYSSASRKRSIIQRICLRGQSYDHRSVPDIMTVHGIYDTDVKTKSFSSMRGYQSYLEKKSAVAKSGYMFLDAVTKAYGKGSAGFLGLVGGGGGFSMHGEVHASAQWSSSQSSHSISQQDQFKQMYMSLLEVEVARYEIFMDDVKPHDLNMDFLHDFTFLPTSYFSAGAPHKFQDFILRYGTHYIKSAKFGGSLRLFKVKQGSKSQSIEQFATKAQSDYKAMFSTYMAAAAQFKTSSLFHKTEAGAEGSVSAGGGTAGASESETQSSVTESEQQQYSNEVLTVEGGDQTIAAVISEMYTVGFKHELVDWLQSIPTYPKPIEMQMAPMSDICNINWKHLFPGAVVNFGCFGDQVMLTEADTGRKYYVWKTNITNDDNTTSIKETRHYCDYADQQGLQDQMQRRCNSLRRAIDVYLEEGPTPVSDIHIPAGRPGCETAQLAFDDIRHSLRTPEWDKLTDGRMFKVIFDVQEPIMGVTAKSSALKVFFRPANKKWYVKSIDEITHLYDGYGNGGSDDTDNKKMSIRGLVLTYIDETGLLQLTSSNYDESLKILPDLPKELINRYVARVEYLHILNEIQQHANEFGIGTIPCNIVWSNAHRFNPAIAGGRCISFAAISAGDIFVIFSAIPRDKDTWYYVQISPNGIAIYKGLRIMKFIDDSSARGLGDHTLFQMYFVCVEEKLDGSGTTILFGKTMDDMERGHVFGAFHDTGENIHVRFYAFGNGDEEVDIMDAHVLRTGATGEHVCVGDTIQFEGKCIEDCHPECIGCHQPDSPKSCSECRNKKLDDTCVSECPDTHFLPEEGDNITCICNVVQDGECVDECSDDRVAIEQPNGGFQCKCRFRHPDDEDTCLAGCPLTTYQVASQNPNINDCIDCHAVCKPQDEGVPVCYGPTPDDCTECYPDTVNGGCLDCTPGQYIYFSKGNDPECRDCPQGYKCPGDGRRYQCSLQHNEHSTANGIDCVECSSGWYSTIPPTQFCHQCSAGFYKKTSTGNCLQCAGNTAGTNCQVTCNCVYGVCIKVDGSCSCWKFFSGHHCEIPSEGALRLRDDRVINSFLHLIKSPEIAKLPTVNKDIVKIKDFVKTPVILAPKLTPRILTNTVDVDQRKVASKSKRAIALQTVLNIDEPYKPDRSILEAQLEKVAIDSNLLKPILTDKIEVSGKIRGRLEYYHNGQWGTVCGKYWTQLNTKVACKQFRYNSGVEKKDGYFGVGSGPIWITKINCQGNEIGLKSCPRPLFWALNVYTSMKIAPCLHADDIGIICY